MATYNSSSSETDMTPNPRHRRRSWSDVVKNDIPKEAEAELLTESLRLDKNRKYYGEEVLVMINHAKTVTTNARGSNWITYKSEKAIKQEKVAQST